MASSSGSIFFLILPYVGRQLSDPRLWMSNRCFIVLLSRTKLPCERNSPRREVDQDCGRDSCGEIGARLAQRASDPTL
jgi:hypothetical protein